MPAIKGNKAKIDFISASIWEGNLIRTLPNAQIRFFYDRNELETHTVKTTSKSPRVVSRVGRFNVTRDTRSRMPFRDLYHMFLRLRWTTFYTIVVTGYLGTNLLFALCYYLTGPSSLEGIHAPGGFSFYLECFFFSVQTFATIGYGHVNPMSLTANLLVTLEALVGLLSVALVTGLLFARFARPTARVLFSNNALVVPRNGVPSLIFRMANERLNQIAEARVTVLLMRDEVTKEGESFRNFYELAVERQTSPVFALTWTVVHPIDERSPLKGLSMDVMRRDKMEIVISVVGHDNTFAQTIHTRFSYTPDDILWWSHRFVDMLRREENGHLHVMLKNIHQVELFHYADCDPCLNSGA